MWTRTANGAKKKLVLHVRLRLGSLSITTLVSLLANELMFEACCTGKWAWQLSIKFVSFMRLWMVEKSKDSLKTCFENVNITLCLWLIDWIINESCYIEIFLQRNFRKLTILWLFSYNSWLQKFGSHNNIAMLYPNLCYNNVCYKGTALYSKCTLISNGQYKPNICKATK